MRSAPSLFHGPSLRRSARLRRQADPPSHALAIRVGVQPRDVDAVHGKLLVAVLGVAGHADRANDCAAGIADQHAAAFRKDLIAAGGNEITHEDWPLLGALANEFRASAE